MKRIALLLAVIAATVAAPAALAKGPTAATITGPGLGHDITIRGFGEPGNPTPLGQLADSGGFFPAVFGQTPDPMLGSRPAGELGPRFTIRYAVPGPRTTSTIVQDAYPYATPQPLTYTAPGQRYWGDRRTHGGWYAGERALKDALVAAGLPETAQGDGSGWPWKLTAAVSAAVLLVAAFALALARRFGRGPEPRIN